MTTEELESIHSNAWDEYRFKINAANAAYLDAHVAYLDEDVLAARKAREDNKARKEQLDHEAVRYAYESL